MAKKKKAEDMSLPRLLEHVIAYWMAHAVSKTVRASSVVALIGELSEMSKDYSPTRAAAYARLLPCHIATEMIKDKNVSADTFLINRIEDVHKKAGEKMKELSKQSNRRSSVSDKGKGFGKFQKGKQSVGKHYYTGAKMVCLGHDPAGPVQT